ncbi:N-acyl homoserine lactonase family protein [Sphingobium lignivorans]
MRHRTLAGPACAAMAALLLMTPAIAQAQTQTSSPASAKPPASAPAAITLTRLDCGEFRQPRDVSAFSDAYVYTDPPLRMPFVASCYLIRHGDRFMLWDAGFAGSNDTILLRRTLPEQLAEIGVDPAKVAFVGISHYHGDHIGQASRFPQAKLLIGAGDWAVLTATPPRYANADPAPLAHWISGGGTVEQLTGDKDVFGDGSVTILNLPGHTPGHHGLLVRLPKTGPVLISGDAVHFRENYEHDRVPGFNTDRADSLASIDRLKAIAKALGAKLIIQHDHRDVASLPAFPEAAE